MSKHKQPLASVRVVFNIHRSADKAGPLQPEDTVEAVERFIRWHERQVAIGKDLLVMVKQQQAAAVAAPPVEAGG